VEETAGDDAERRRNRRGLRQGWLLRRFYEGHLVPDAPTSPGENARVLPAPHAPVPDEQIFMPHRRRRRLFDGDPLPRHLGKNGLRVLQKSIEDLCHPAELGELGKALFLDRPLGIAKDPLEPDRTLLLSYETFSRSLAEKRLNQIARDPLLGPNASVEVLRIALRQLQCEGVPVPRVTVRPRPVVSLQDAFKVAEDFVILRSTRTTVRDFLGQYDLTPLSGWMNLDLLGSDTHAIILGETNEQGEPVLLIYDSRIRRRVEMRILVEQGYVTRGGAEYPRQGLQVSRVWDVEPDREIDLSGERLVILSNRPEAEMRGASASGGSVAP
jgi:hypothetical protein